MKVISQRKHWVEKRRMVSGACMETECFDVKLGRWVWKRWDVVPSRLPLTGTWTYTYSPEAQYFYMEKLSD